jgi:hypothetical protein
MMRLNRSRNGIGGGMTKKRYPCDLAPDGMCKYGGNKVYNYGFVQGTESFCRHSKKLTTDIESCPLKDADTGKEGVNNG